MFTAKFYCGNDICNISAAHNQPRLPVDHGVVDFSCRVESRVAWPDELSTQFGFESSNYRFAQHNGLPIETCRPEAQNMYRLKLAYWKGPMSAKCQKRTSHVSFEMKEAANRGGLALLPISPETAVTVSVQ
ncbi:MAG: hypothetical protein WB769_01030 [Pseudolabrys sp.]